MGRYFTKDIVSGHNLYVYCNNNPVNLIDPIGFAAQIVDLDNGWKYRIDSANPDMNLRRHIHVWNDKEGWYAQNDDGSPHDKGKNGHGSGPPSSVKKKLKDKSGWDWDKKVKDYKDEQNKKIASDVATGADVVVGGYIIYRVVRFVPSLFPPLWWTIPINAVTP